MDAVAQEILDTIRSYHVYLDETVGEEIKSAFDSVSHYKKLLRGAVRFVSTPGEGIGLN